MADAGLDRCGEVRAQISYGKAVGSLALSSGFVTMIVTISLGEAEVVFSFVRKFLRSALIVCLGGWGCMAWIARAEVELDRAGHISI